MVILWIVGVVLFLAWVLAVKGLLVLLIAGAGDVREGAIVMGVLAGHAVLTVYAMSHVGAGLRVVVMLLAMLSLWGCLNRLVRGFSGRKIIRS